MTEINVDPILLSKPDQLNQVLINLIRKDIIPLISQSGKKDIKDKAKLIDKNLISYNNKQLIDLMIE